MAAARAAPAERRAALDDLARAYWFPLFAYARRRGLATADAQDRVQGFFAELLAREDVARADPERGRFRAFLLTAFQRHIGHAHERERAHKRSGGQAPLSLDFEGAEARLAREPAHADTPERAFERAWASELVERAFARLAAEHAKIGREPLFQRLRPALAAEDDAPSMASVARELAMTENAVKVAAHRMRKRFGELLREEIAETLSDSTEVEDEIRALFRVFEPPC